jgi:hypothetical protein|tara:strand:- start:24 stop:332 length:309 start_codon:yes stop_codon:yes gene_type:complete
MANEIDRFDAITSLVGGIIMHGDEVTYVDGQTPPTEEQIQAEITRLQAEYDALDYARARDVSYPSLKEFAEAYTEKEIGGDDAKWNEYVSKYNKVRTDNPKE